MFPFGDMSDVDPQNVTAVRTIAFGLLLLAGLLFIITHVLKFKFVFGVTD